MSLQDQPERDLVSQVVGYIETGVGFVRDNATGRVVTAVRALVFGLLAAIVGVVLLVLLAIVLVRALYLLPGHRGWLAYGIAGLVFVAAGAVLMRKRNAKPAN